MIQKCEVTGCHRDASTKLDKVYTPYRNTFEHEKCYHLCYSCRPLCYICETYATCIVLGERTDEVGTVKPKSCWIGKEPTVICLQCYVKVAIATPLINSPTLYQ